MSAFFERLRGEHVLIVGFSGRTGFECARYFMRYGVCVSISDCRADEELKRSLPGEPVHFYTGVQGLDQLQGIDRIVLSPGVPRSIALIREAQRIGIPVVSEIELSYLLLRSAPPKKLIGITGTDGKTTTAHLITHLLRQRYDARLFGNSGVPLISAIDELSSDAYVVLELSSFMLEDLQWLRCEVACLLNLAEDHLDRYESFESYRKTKYNIFRYQKENDCAVLNCDDVWYKEALGYVCGETVCFSVNNSNARVYCDDCYVWVENVKVFSFEDIPRYLFMYKENLLAALAVIWNLGLCVDDIVDGLRSFKPLAHRQEYVREVDGVRFINDSKATTVHAVGYALRCYDSVILLMGGVAKCDDFAFLLPVMKERVKCLLLFGQDREKIARQLEFYPMELLDDLNAGVFRGFSLAGRGDCVLLSPGCASFDEYKDYEERGAHFRKLVHEL